MIAETVLEKAPAKPLAPQAEGSTSGKLGGLVLARQVGQLVMIGDDVEVEVVGLKSSTARIRITAPRSVGVHRREVYDAIRLAPRPQALGAQPAPSGISGGLVLSRRAGQTIMIGDDVAIDVVDVRPGAVRLRIIAPRSVAVHRKEIFDAIKRGEARPSSD